MKGLPVTTIEQCRACGAGRVARLLDLGPQPPSNRYPAAGSEDDDAYPLVLGQCTECGLLQLIEPMQPDMVRSRHSWLSYNEPEGHLDSLVARLCELIPNNGDARILGVTYKDGSTLSRFQGRGYGSVYCLDPLTDLGVHEPNAGLETIQGALGKELGLDLARRHGKADLVIVRHVLEHVHKPAAFLQGLLALTKPGGYLVLEVPDSSKFVHSGDYCFLWEEHIAYFSERTLKSFLQGQGAELLAIWRYPYAMEDSLIAVVRCPATGASRRRVSPVLKLAEETTIGWRFAEQFNEVRDAYRVHLAALREQGKRIAAFGAGHLGAKFLNFFGLSEFVECVIDDNPHKDGLCMPGSRLPIVGSAKLYEPCIDLCLLSLSPESEAKLLVSRQDYLEAGGVFRSMFSLSPIALWRDVRRGIQSQ